MLSAAKFEYVKLANHHKEKRSLISWGKGDKISYMHATLHFVLQEFFLIQKQGMRAGVYSYQEQWLTTALSLESWKEEVLIILTFHLYHPGIGNHYKVQFILNTLTFSSIFSFRC